MSIFYQQCGKSFVYAYVHKFSKKTLCVKQRGNVKFAVKAVFVLLNNRTL